MQQRLNKNTKDHLWATLLLLPTLIPLLVFWIYPLLKTLQISFTDWNYISPTYNNVGLENYINLAEDGFFMKVMLNTAVFTFSTVVPSIVLGLWIAVKINAIKKLKSFFLTSIFSSWITPVVVVSMVWTGIFDKDNGIVNMILIRFGIEGVKWLGMPHTAMLVVILVTIWQYTGLSTLLFSVALAKLDPEVEKANALDGGSGMRKLFAITLPSISPTIVFLFVLFTLDSLKAYDQIYILTQGGPAGATSTILYYFYTLAFEFYESGPASALAIAFLFLCLLVSAINYLTSKALFKN